MNLPHRSTSNEVVASPGEEDNKRKTDKLHPRVMTMTSAHTPDSALPIASDQTGARNEGSSTEKEAHDPTPTYGRRGDPRMHRAVIAKQKNPKISLLDALLTGGFVFPGLGDPGMSDRTIRDADNVLLYQRKNQLNRRLRLARTTAAGHDRSTKAQKLDSSTNVNAGDSESKSALSSSVGTGKNSGMPTGTMRQPQPFMALPLEMQQNLQQTLLSMSASGMITGNLMGGYQGMQAPLLQDDRNGGSVGAAAPSAISSGAYNGPTAQNLMSMALLSNLAQQSSVAPSEANAGDTNAKMNANANANVNLTQMAGALPQQSLQGAANFFAQQQQLQQQQQMQMQDMNRFNNAALLASLMAGQGNNAPVNQNPEGQGSQKSELSQAASASKQASASNAAPATTSSSESEHAWDPLAAKRT